MRIPDFGRGALCIFAAAVKTGTETVIHNFTGGSGDGAVPYAGLLNVKGALYGTTVDGGANGDGTVFALKP
jgi:uncharacterized repeat protein (TIGR03803 family)